MSAARAERDAGECRKSATSGPTHPSRRSSKSFTEWIIFPPISFRPLFGLLILEHDQREILWFGVTEYPTAEWIARQLAEAFGWQMPPRHLVRDRNHAYGAVFVRLIRAIGIRDRPIAARLPWHNGYCERAICSIRRDCLDHIIVFGARHLRHLLRCYASYYTNPERVFH
jgi:hypothetical protein